MQQMMKEKCFKFATVCAMHKKYQTHTCLLKIVFFLANERERVKFGREKKRHIMVIINYNNGTNTISIEFKNNEFLLRRKEQAIERESGKELMLMPFDSSADLQVCAILIYRYTEFLVAVLSRLLRKKQPS